MIRTGSDITELKNHINSMFRILTAVAVVAAIQGEINALTCQDAPKLEVCSSGSGQCRTVSGSAVEQGGTGGGKRVRTVFSFSSLLLFQFLFPPRMETEATREIRLARYCVFEELYSNTQPFPPTPLITEPSDRHRNAHPHYLHVFFFPS